MPLQLSASEGAKALPCCLSAMSRPLWTPSEEGLHNTNLFRFRKFVNRECDEEFDNYSDLHAWSVSRSDKFWSLVWDYCGVIGDKGERRLIDGHKMPGATFFPDASINFAENLLRRRDESDALVFWAEDRVKTCMSWGEFYDAVSRMAQALKELGVEPGDRISAILPNMPEAVVAMLAASSIGAIWSSCSPDFGEQGVLDRFGQIEPKVLISADGYFYNGKAFDVLPKLAGIVAGLPTLEKVVVVPFLGSHADQLAEVGDIDKAVSYSEFTSAYKASDIEFERFTFNHPL